MKPVTVLLIILICVAVFFVGRAILASRDRLEEWLLARRLYGLAFAAFGMLMYLAADNLYNRGLGGLLVVSGLIGLALERSSAPSRVLIHRVHMLLLASPVILAVWTIATLPPPALWYRLGYCALVFAAMLMILQESRRTIAADHVRFQQWAHARDAELAALEARPKGPNAPQVRAFLAALNRLMSDEWATVKSREVPAVAAVRALEQAGRAAERTNAVALLSNHLYGDYWRGSVASMAVEALVVRDRISERDFKTLYAPFEPLIPIAGLGGHAPSTPG